MPVSAGTSTVGHPYRGRFAPSPTGLLHLGSLVAALASWLDARAHAGTWLVRMEDLDGPRCVPGAADAILATLAAFGLSPDEPVMYQSTRHPAYQQALARLRASGEAYRCICSRSDSPAVYDGHCRDLDIQDPRTAWRLRLPAGSRIAFDDAIQGPITVAATDIGDPVIFRRDQLAAYQLAVVVDDAAQGITHVVRGADLLDSTAWQLAIAKALSLPAPRHAHVPLVTEPDGSKLAKSRRSLPVDPSDVPARLVEALALLQLQPSERLTTASVSDILGWAVEHWQPSRLAGIRCVQPRR